MTKDDYEIHMFSLAKEYKQKEKEIMVQYARD